MDQKDLKASLIIGGLVGILIQPILSNNLPNVHLSSIERFGVFVFFLVFAPFALWICSLIAKIWKSFYQFAKFAAVGTLNSFIDIGVFNLETFFYGSGMIGTALFATFKAISFLFGTTNSFLWNKYWTFSVQEKPKASEVTGFYSIAILGWIVNVGVATLVKASRPDGSRVWINLIAPLSGIALSFIINFIGYKYFVFKKKPTPQAE
jgi:putative flippase GtrA